MRLQESLLIFVIPFPSHRDDVANNDGHIAVAASQDDLVGFGRDALGRSPKSNLLSSAASRTLKPCLTMNELNCQSFSNIPLQSMIALRFSCGWYAVILK